MALGAGAGAASDQLEEEEGEAEEESFPAEAYLRIYCDLVRLAEHFVHELVMSCLCLMILFASSERNSLANLETSRANPWVKISYLCFPHSCS